MFVYRTVSWGFIPTHQNKLWLFPTRIKYIGAHCSVETVKDSRSKGLGLDSQLHLQISYIDDAAGKHHLMLLLPGYLVEWKLCNWKYLHTQMLWVFYSQDEIVQMCVPIPERQWSAQYGYRHQRTDHGSLSLHQLIGTSTSLRNTQSFKHLTQQWNVYSYMYTKQILNALFKPSHTLQHSVAWT